MRGSSETLNPKPKIVNKLGLLQGISVLDFSTMFCPSMRVCACLHACIRDPTVCPSIHPSVCLFASLRACPSIYLPVFLSVCQSHTRSSST
jgi:hypothetical protein